MLGLQRTVYATATLEAVAGSYKAGTPEGMNARILSSTCSYAITKVRDTLSSLEQMTQDPRTIRGGATHMARMYAKEGVPLELRAMNTQTEGVRSEHFSAMAPVFEQLDSHTNRLGAAVELLATYLAHSLGERDIARRVLAAKIVQFSPEAKYNDETGKVEYRVTGGNYARLASFKESEGLRQALGEDRVAQSLLELKLAGAALKATIDASTLREVKEVKNYPGDPHSEVMDAVQTVEANLGYLSTQKLPDELSTLIRKAIPGRVTELAQVYVDHRANPWSARIAGVLGLTSGTAALVLGVPQILHWISQGSIDLTYTPELPTIIGQTTALALTSYGLTASIFSFLTLGSEIGSKLVRDLRKIELHKLKEI